MIEERKVNFDILRRLLNRGRVIDKYLLQILKEKMPGTTFYQDRDLLAALNAIAPTADRFAESLGYGYSDPPAVLDAAYGEALIREGLYERIKRKWVERWKDENGRPSFLTTEFWTIGFFLAAVFSLCFTGRLSGWEASKLSALAAGVYMIARTLYKAGRGLIYSGALTSEFYFFILQCYFYIVLLWRKMLTCQQAIFLSAILVCLYAVCRGAVKHRTGKTVFLPR